MKTPTVSEFNMMLKEKGFEPNTTIKIDPSKNSGGFNRLVFSERDNGTSYCFFFREGEGMGTSYRKLTSSQKKELNSSFFSLMIMKEWIDLKKKELERLINESQFQDEIGLHSMSLYNETLSIELMKEIESLENNTFIGDPNLSIQSK